VLLVVSFELMTTPYVRAPTKPADRARRLDTVRMTNVPNLLQVVLDCTDVRELAEFYRHLMGYGYRPGDEPRDDEEDVDWLVLRDEDGVNRLAFQKVDELPPATWPTGPHPQQLHLDMTVTSVDALKEQHDRALALGARLLLDRTDDPDEPLRVYADPAGHPFCVFVVPV
jgi:hypothetical protein